MARGPQFKPGDKVVYRSNPLNREAVRSGTVKRMLTDESEENCQPKYVIQDMASGKQSTCITTDIVRRM